MRGPIAGLPRPDEARYGRPVRFGSRNGDEKSIRRKHRQVVRSERTKRAIRRFVLPVWKTP